MPYSDNHSGAAQDRAMGTGTGPGCRAWTAADYDRQAALIRAGMAAVEARRAGPSPSAMRAVTIHGQNSDMVITRDALGVWLSPRNPLDKGTVPVLIPAELIAQVAGVLGEMGE